MKILITGAAGFIGSHLSEKLLQNQANTIIGIDDFIGPTPMYYKDDNIKSFVSNPRFQLIRGSLLTIDLASLLQDIDVIYHLAAIPGVRASWGKEFAPYVVNNISATQRLLEACKTAPVKKVIYSSTSSIYGEHTGKVTENLIPKPLSPYGVTKLTGEHLCHVYRENFDIPIIILRYFTVYGPRQRPDMGFHRFIKQILTGKPVTIFGSGKQTRDFTYISDCIEATSSIIEHGDDLIGETINIGGNERASVLDVIALLRNISKLEITEEYTGNVYGEPTQTWADITKATKLLNYLPTTTLEEGLTEEFLYLKQYYRK